MPNLLLDNSKSLQFTVGFMYFCLKAFTDNDTNLYTKYQGKRGI